MLEKTFLETRVVAIIRGIPNNYLKPLIEALAEGGIRLAEITMNSPDVLDSIHEMRNIFEGKVHIGAGTVINQANAISALDAGAEFIVTPNVNKQVIELCCNRDILIMPGALTPTEIVNAMSYGSKYVKIFPASAFGPKYFHEVLAPLNSANLIAVGGVNTENAAQYIQNGAVGVGVGGSLCNLQRLQKQDFAGITEDTKKLIANCSIS